MENINHERKTIMIRWHGLRQYRGTDIVGMRGYPEHIIGAERYELALIEGIWKCHYYIGDAGNSRWFPNPIYRLVAENADLYAVIRVAEEHAYMIYHLEPEIENEDG